TWAFAMKEAAARREGYDQGEIHGTLGFDASYPGCPHCGAHGLLKCSHCGKVGCWDGQEGTMTCPWCGATGRLGGTIDRLGADRLATSVAIPHEVLLAQPTRRLRDNLGLADEFARWAVESWALALGVISSTETSVSEDVAQAPTASSTSTSPHSPISSLQSPA